MALGDKVCELAVADNPDHARRFQLLDVMRKGRGADLLTLVEDAVDNGSSEAPTCLRI